LLCIEFGIPEYSGGKGNWMEIRTSGDYQVPQSVRRIFQAGKSTGFCEIVAVS